MQRRVRRYLRGDWGAPFVWRVALLPQMSALSISASVSSPNRGWVHVMASLGSPSRTVVTCPFGQVYRDADISMVAV